MNECLQLTQFSIVSQSKEPHFLITYIHTHDDVHTTYHMSFSLSFSSDPPLCSHLPDLSLLSILISLLSCLSFLCSLFSSLLSCIPLIIWTFLCHFLLILLGHSAGLLPFGTAQYCLFNAPFNCKIKSQKCINVILCMIDCLYLLHIWCASSCVCVIDCVLISWIEVKYWLRYACITCLKIAK